MQVYMLLLLGLVLLVYGGNMLVDGSVAVAKRLGVSSLLIGLVLVGFGTSTPELMASLIAMYKNAEGIAVGNVVGSNIANILLVLGCAALVFPVDVDLKAFKRDGLVLFISAVLLGFCIYIGGISRVYGLVFTVMMLGYVVYSYYSDKKMMKKEKPLTKHEIEKLPPIYKSLFLTFTGILITMLGAKFLVDNAILLARHWKISESVIGLTVVAVGTSLPELTASIIAALKKENGVAFGNVVGSNIYNTLFILGTVALFMPISAEKGMLLNVIVMLIATLILCLIALMYKRFTRPIGVLFLLLYGMYMVYLF